MFLYNPENCKNNAQIIIQEKPARVSNIHDRPIECQVDLITKQKKTRRIRRQQRIQKFSLKKCRLHFVCFSRLNFFFMITREGEQEKTGHQC